MVAPDHSTLVMRDFGSGLEGLDDWIEELIAESTGKNGTGLLPVVAGTDAPDLLASGTLDVRLVELAEGEEGEGDITVAGTLGAQFLLWEYATAISCSLMGVGAFDQPDVESSKTAARRLLDSQPQPEPVSYIDDGIEVRATPGLLDGVSTIEGAVNALIGIVDPKGYLAVMAYLDREEYKSLASIRAPLASRVRRPVTFGWGPRFLHSTGQLHKGGPPLGAFLQITGSFSEDLDIPGGPLSFGTLIAAQAAGDAKVLGVDYGRPVLRLNLTHPAQVERIRSVLGV